MRSGKAIDLDPAALDYTAFSEQDLVNIVLQRSEIVRDVPRYGKLIRAWQAGDAAPLQALVASGAVPVAERAATAIRAEFDDLRPTLDALAPRRIADIGCGYAIFDLYAHHAYGADLLLVDIESNDRRHFGFKEEGAAYASLPKARAFLAGNGVPADHIVTWNPQTEDAPKAEPVDLAVSFLSCGFHYPVDMYMSFFQYGVTERGAVILDLRPRAFDGIKKTLSHLGRVETLGTRRGCTRVILRKGPAP